MMNWMKLLKRRGDVEIHQTSGGKEAGSFTPGFHPDPREKRTIKLYLKEIKEIYTFLYGRAPTDKELEQHFLETLYHESGHAAHEDVEKPTAADPKGWNMMEGNTKNVFDKEWVAFSTQFPDKPYYVMIGLMNHGFINEYAKQVFGKIARWLNKMIPDNYNRRDQSERGAWGDDLLYEMRNKLLTLHYKYGKVESSAGRFVDLNAANVPKTKKEALEMYGEEHKDFIKTLRLPGSLDRKNPWS